MPELKVTNKFEDSKLFSLLQVLLIIIIFTVVLHIFWQALLLVANTDNRVLNDIVNRFNLDEELSFPTWVSSVMAFIVAGLAWIVGKNQKQSKQRLIWYLISSVAMFISIDEVAALHELLLQGLHILAHFGEKQSLLANAWLLIAPVIIIGFIVGVRLMNKNLPADTFKRLVVALLVYLLGALVVEYASIPLNKSSIIYNLVAVVIEESLELLGVWLVIRAILIHVTLHEKKLYKKLIDMLM